MWNHNNPADSEIETSVEDAFEWIGEKFMLITGLIRSQFVALAALLALLVHTFAYEIYARVFGDHSGALVIFTPDSYYWFWPFVSSVSAVLVLYVVGLPIFLTAFYYAVYTRLSRSKFSDFLVVVAGLCILIPICLSVYYLYFPLFNLFKSWF